MLAVRLLANQNPNGIHLSNEMETHSKQIGEWSLTRTGSTSLARSIQLNIRLVGIIAIEIAYFLSLIVEGTVFIRAVLVFPAVYILPGLVLRLSTSKSNPGYMINLLVESFVVSTAINVVTVSLLIVFNAQHYHLLLSLLNLLVVVSAGAFAKVRNVLSKLPVNNIDAATILLCFVTFMVAINLYSSTPRLLTPDETSYVVNARYALLNGKVYDVSAGTVTSAFACLIKGRFFWTLLTASFLASTGLKAHFSHLLSPMFLIMVALASVCLIPESSRRQGLLRFSVIAVSLTNPLLFYSSGFILNDLAMAFYITFSLALFINSFRQSDPRESIDLSKLCLCTVVFLLATVFIKWNILVVFSMYAVLLFFVLRQKATVVHRRLLYVLLILPIAYELFIDLPFVISNWFFNNRFFAQMFYRVLWVSPLEGFLGLFIVRPWGSTTLFSYDAIQYLQLIYTMISPEVLGIILASMALAAPLGLMLKWIRKDWNMFALALLLSMTMPIVYFALLSGYSYMDAPRFCLFLLPMIVAFSLAILNREIHEGNTWALLIFCIPSVLFLWIFAFLILQVGTIYFYYSYGTQYLNWTISLVAPQLVVFIAILSLVSFRNTRNTAVGVPFAKLKVLKNLSLSKVLYSAMIIAIVLQNVHFSVYCVRNSSFLGHRHGLEDIDRFLGGASGSSMIFSNTYVYMRTYIPDDFLAHSRLFPLPDTEDDFLRLLDFASDGSLIFISTDPEMTWLEPANGYIKKYVDQDIIVSNTSKSYAIRVENEQLSTGLISLFRIANSPTIDEGSSRIVVNDARLVRLDDQEKVLQLNISSSESDCIKIMIGTDRSVELYNITLSSGNAILRLRGGSHWHHLTKVSVSIEDENGNKLYNGNVEMFNFEGIQLSFTAITIIMVILFLLLMMRSKPRRVPAHLVEMTNRVEDSSKTDDAMKEKGRRRGAHLV